MTDAPHQPGQADFRSVLPEDIDFEPFPSFPPSASLAVVVGHPPDPGPYVVRVKATAGTKLMPHRHHEDRVYTVISGVFYIGLGDQFDESMLQAYPPGSVVVLPGGTSHFHWAKSGDYITQVQAIGPISLDYVNAEDDPRELSVVMVQAPLAGVRVLELGVALAVPSAAALLGDWGAEVIKVEPHSGDPQRGNTANSYFSQDNRGKRSIALDLATDQGRAIMLTLVDRCDVFVTNIRPGGLERLGMDAATLLDRNPRLVYGLLTGYGTEGPAAGRAGYDIGAFWSRSGVVGALVGDGEPPVQRPAMGDHTTGLALVAAISAALFDRERTGKGRLVETSLVRTGAYVISSDLAAHANGEHPEAGLRRALYNPLLACYRAGDGRWFFLLGLEATRHWPNVAAAVDREDLLADPRFGDFLGLITNRDDLIAILDEEFARRPLGEWAEIFDAHDVWWDPVQSFDEVSADPIMQQAGVFRPMQGGRTAIAAPAEVGAPDPGSEVGAAPELGQHTEEILLELGFDWKAISALVAQRVIP